MDFLFAMSVFTSAADVSLDKGRAREWLTAWAAPRDGSAHGGAAAAETGKLPQQRRRDGAEAARAEEEKKKPQGRRRRPWVAPEFDGLNCFETIVSH